MIKDARFPQFCGGPAHHKIGSPTPRFAASTGVWLRFVVASLMPKTGSHFLARCSAAASFPGNVPDKLVRFAPRPPVITKMTNKNLLEATMTQAFASFEALSAFYREQIETPGFDTAFAEQGSMAQLSVHEEPMATDMPDAQAARGAMEMAIGTIFDLLRSTRMEEFAQDIVWGFVNSFHVTAQRIEKREDEASKKLGDMARAFDPSEIYAVELEETQRICQTLMDCREAMEAMRDYAGEIYRVETGRPFSTVRGSRVSSGLTASQIDARDFLAARSAKRREDHAPTGPVVIFSGGTDWHDHELLWDALDETHARIPNMILATTAQHKGCDQIAHAWAAARGVKTVRFTLNRALGKRAGFLRNEQLMNLKPVHAMVCEGSGIQANLLTRVREANVPHHAFGLRHQRVAA